MKEWKRLDPIEIIKKTNLDISTKNHYIRALNEFKNSRVAFDSSAICHFMEFSPDAKYFRAAIKRWIKEEFIHNDGDVLPPFYIKEFTTALFKFKYNPALKLSSPRILDSDEIQRLFKCDLKWDSGIRDYIAIALLLSAGLKRNEAVGLTFAQISRFTKRSVIKLRDRTIPLHKNLIPILDNWGSKLNSRGYVLRALNNGEIQETLTGHGLAFIVKNKGERIGIDNLTPSDLRHTFAQTAYNKGDSPKEIAYLMGVTVSRLFDILLLPRQNVSEIVNNIPIPKGTNNV